MIEYEVILVAKLPTFVMSHNIENYNALGIPLTDKENLYDEAMSEIQHEKAQTGEGFKVLDKVVDAIDKYSMYRIKSDPDNEEDPDFKSVTVKSGDKKVKIAITPDTYMIPTKDGLIVGQADTFKFTHLKGRGARLILDQFQKAGKLRKFKDKEVAKAAFLYNGFSQYGITGKSYFADRFKKLNLPEKYRKPDVDYVYRGMTLSEENVAKLKSGKSATLGDYPHASFSPNERVARGLLLNKTNGVLLKVSTKNMKLLLNANHPAINWVNPYKYPIKNSDGGFSYQPEAEYITDGPGEKVLDASNIVSTTWKQDSSTLPRRTVEKVKPQHPIKKGNLKQDPSTLPRRTVEKVKPPYPIKKGKETGYYFVTPKGKKYIPYKDYEKWNLKEWYANPKVKERMMEKQKKAVMRKKEAMEKKQKAQ